MLPLRALRALAEGRERGIALIYAILVVAICWAVILAGGDRVKSLDEPDFVAIAQNLAFEGRFAGPDGELTAYRAPGMAFFLTPFVRLGAGIVELRLANAVLVGLGLVLLFGLVQRRAGPLAGLFAVFMVPVWPVVIYGASTLYPQTLAAFLLVLTIWCLERIGDGQGLRLPVLAGLACGGLILTVPVILLLFPLLAGWILLYAPRRLLQTTVFTLVSALAVCTWTARNYVAFDAFVPVATSSGYNLLAGNTAEARYNTSLDVRFPEEVYTAMTGTTEVERNDILTKAAIREITADPARAAKLYLGKFLHWFHFSNDLLSDQAVEGGASAIRASSREIILFVTYCTVILLPLTARLAMLRRFPFAPIEVLFLILWIGAGLVYALYFTRVRFRLPFDWLLIASNGMFLAALVDSRLNWRPGR